MQDFANKYLAYAKIANANFKRILEEEEKVSSSWLLGYKKLHVPMGWGFSSLKIKGDRVIAVMELRSYESTSYFELDVTDNKPLESYLNKIREHNIRYAEKLLEHQKTEQRVQLN